MYVAEKKRPKTESFFQTKALDVSEDEGAGPLKPDQAVKVLRAGQGQAGEAHRAALDSVPTLPTRTPHPAHPHPTLPTPHPTPRTRPTLLPAPRRP